MGGRRFVRWCCVGLLLVAAQGCVWLQNEFFVFDVPPPMPEAVSGSDAGQ